MLLAEVFDGARLPAHRGALLRRSRASCPCARRLGRHQRAHRSALAGHLRHARRRRVRGPPDRAELGWRGARRASSPGSSRGSTVTPSRRSSGSARRSASRPRPWATAASVPRFAQFRVAPVLHERADRPVAGAPPSTDPPERPEVSCSRIDRSPDRRGGSRSPRRRPASPHPIFRPSTRRSRRKGEHDPVLDEPRPAGEPDAPFAGLRVVDLGTFWAGPVPRHVPRRARRRRHQGRVDPAARRVPVQRRVPAGGRRLVRAQPVWQSPTSTSATSPSTSAAAGPGAARAAHRRPPTSCSRTSPRASSSSSGLGYDELRAIKPGDHHVAHAGLRPRGSVARLRRLGDGARAGVGDGAGDGLPAEADAPRAASSTPSSACTRASRSRRRCCTANARAKGR